jgi:hypothetical protein
LPGAFENGYSKHMKTHTPKPKPDVDHHLKEWTSGKRGGGKVPADFGWRTNPKQQQEENGANVGTEADKKDKKP